MRTRDLKIASIVLWRGKQVDESMTKEELILIIQALAQRVEQLESLVKRHYNNKQRAD